jgi:hypothetical protein
MMMGPEPMMRTERIEVSLGMGEGLGCSRKNKLRKTKGAGWLFGRRLKDFFPPTTIWFSNGFKGENT